MAKQYRDFESARNFVHELELKTTSEWKKYCKSGKKPKDIPANPNETKSYQKYWKGYPDWLGINSYNHGLFKEFTSARNFARNLSLSSYEEWKKYAQSKKRPIDIPQYPEKIYKKSGWDGYPDWLGYGKLEWKKLSNLELIL